MPAPDREEDIRDINNRLVCLGRQSSKVPLCSLMLTLRSSLDSSSSTIGAS